MKWVMATTWRRRVAGALIILVAVLAGVAIGLWSRPITPSLASDGPADLGPFWKAWDLLDKHFVSTSASSTTATASVPSDQKVWGAIGGLVDAYEDPYTVFLPPEENKLFGEEISGNFGGVGMEIGVRDNVITVIAPLPDTPAKKAGLVPGDQVLEIDGKSTYKMPTDEAIKLIRGEVGTVVKLKVLSKDAREARELSITRALIKVPTIETETRADHIFVIRLFSFGATAAREFKAALKEFAAAKTDKLILDLRGNPGGYLDSAVEIASWFLPKEAVVVTEDRGQNGAPIIYHSQGYNVFTDKLKMVILVDGGSASASEILAGALSQHHVATLVGEQTFGKGSVQEVFPITKDTSLKVTVARWLTPDGTSISHEGLKPDVAVKSATSTPARGQKTELDPQLEAAVKLLQKMK